MPNCYGFIILDINNQSTVLVESSKGNLSYPKGKIEKTDKSDFDCAVRELQEETGITKDMVNIVPEILFSEYKKDGVGKIHYYVATLKDIKIEKFKYDPEELKSVNWYHFDTINKLNNLRESRKDVFNQVRTLLQF
jgi:8-oxo-dGTP pyrophosphatase MutT (NUDIX family)